MAEITRLPGPVALLWDWQLEGACRGVSPEVFFHPEGERGPRRRNRDAQAKAVCAACPVVTACRSHALEVREPYGVWGGLTEAERDRVHEGEPVQAASRADVLSTHCGPVHPVTRTQVCR
ncbi:MAG: WhiB family transcriptional regulator [Terracoccus sp.]